MTLDAYLPSCHQQTHPCRRSPDTEHVPATKNAYAVEYTIAHYRDVNECPFRDDEVNFHALRSDVR